MSDFDPKDIHKDVTGDFHPDDVHEDITPQPQISAGESALAGAQQGMTLGMAPPMSAVLPSAMNALQGDQSPTALNAKLAAQGFTGDIGPKSTLELYRQLRDAKKQELQAAAQAHPIANLAGGLAGAGLLTGGIGIAAASDVPGAAIAQKVLNPLPAAPGASLAAKVRSAAATGAVGNTIYGAGSGPQDYTNSSPEDIAKDVTGNAVNGAIFGGGLQLGASAASGAAGLMSQLPIVKDVVAATKGAYSGKEYSGQTNAIQDKVRDLSSKILQAGKDVAYGKFANKRAAVSAATEATGEIDVTPQLDSILEDIKKLPEDTPEQVQAKTNMQNIFGKMRYQNIPVESSTIKFNRPEMEKDLELKAAQMQQRGIPATTNISTVKGPSGQNILNPSITSQGGNESTQTALPSQFNITATPTTTMTQVPMQAKMTPAQLVDKMRELQAQYPQGAETTQARQFLSQAANKMEAPLEQAVPNLPALNKQSKDAMDAFERLTGKSIFDLPQGDNVANASAIDKVSKMVAGAEQQPQKLQDFLNGFGGVPASQNAPATAATAGLSASAPNTAAYIQQKAPELAQDLRLANLTSNSNEHSEGIWKTLVGGLGALGVKTGEAIGKASRELTPESLRAKSVNANGVGRLLDLDSQGLTAVAQDMAAQNHPAATQYSKTLMDAANKQGINRTAAIYSLMQQPQFRQLLMNSPQKPEAPEGP
jgi:hypothetical protein